MNHNHLFLGHSNPRWLPWPILYNLILTNNSQSSSFQIGGRNSPPPFHKFRSIFKTPVSSSLISLAPIPHLVLVLSLSFCSLTFCLCTYLSVNIISIYVCIEVSLTHISPWQKAFHAHKIQSPYLTLFCPFQSSPFST